MGPRHTHTKWDKQRAVAPGKISGAGLQHVHVAWARGHQPSPKLNPLTLARVHFSAGRAKHG
jgi:hypothetical protein